MEVPDTARAVYEGETGEGGGDIGGEARGGEKLNTEVWTSLSNFRLI